MNEIYVKDIAVNKLFDWLDQHCLAALEIPWQQEVTVEEWWEECRRHAEKLCLIRAIGAPAAIVPQNQAEAPAGTGAAAWARALLGERIVTDLFGDEVAARRRTRR